MNSVVHIDVTSRAGAGAAAFRDDFRDIVTNGRLHDRRSEFRIHGAGGAFRIDESDSGHETILWK